MSDRTASQAPIVGAPLDRVDGRLKVTGGARYSAEMPVANAVHAVMITSTIARGKVARMDISSAEKAPGVLAVLTPANAPKLPNGPRAPLDPPAGRVLTLMQDDLVHYNGQPIGLVVADTLEHAQAAASMVRTTYAKRQPELDMATASPAPTGGSGKPPGKEPVATTRGDLSAGLAQAQVRVEHTYTTPFETHNPMEPHATIATWEGDHLTLYDATQGVFSDRNIVAKTFGIPPENVRVVSYFVGGGFGSKGSAWSHVMLAAMAARQVGRPVKLVISRRQMFGPVGGRPRTVQRITLGATRDGVLTAIRHTSTSATSELEEWMEPCAVATRMLYASPNAETDHKLVRINMGTPTFMRAPGEASGTFAIESAMDEMAYALHMDPIAFRLKNYAEKDPQTGKPFSSKSLRECYSVGAEKFGWSKRTMEPRSMRDGNALIGWGMATATYPTRRSPASAAARILPDGRGWVRAGSQDIGTGTYTVMTQVAADAQSPLHGASEGDVRTADGKLSLASNPTKSETYGAVIARNGGQPVEAEASVRPGVEAEELAMHSFGAVFAEVRVDRDLGQIRVPRVVGVYGVGKLLNAKTARSQFLGGIVYGIGMALMEETQIDPHLGRYMNADLAEYHVPVNADVQTIDVSVVEENDTRVNPLGVKGIGEIGNTGISAALANAVYHASGKRVRDLPVTLDKVM